MTQDLGRTLHALTARLDREADRMLRAQAGLSYSRFLAMHLIDAWGAETQRALAESLGVTEPSVSRMIRVLVEAGLAEVSREPGSGNRRRVRLTTAGTQCVQRCGGLLEKHLAELVVASGIPYETYADHTKRLLGTLDGTGDRSRRDTSMLDVASTLPRGGR